MNAVGWACLEAAAGLLEPGEREAVLGDLAEYGCGIWRGLGDVLGLALRRQAALWTSWRPWAASVGLAWPASLFLMGNSVAMSAALLRAERDTILAAIGRLIVLALWAWVAGFAAGTIARRTLWASALACALPCCFCLSLWPGSWFGAWRLLFFLAPAFCGAWQGRRRGTPGLRLAVIMAAVAMLIPAMGWKSGGLCGVSVLWPAVYLVMTARRSAAPA